MDHSEQLDFSLKTFGCKVNTYDSSLLESQLVSQGLARTEKSAAPKVHVLNSCAVTAEATTEVLREARRIKRGDPTSLVVVTGCSAQVDTARLSDEPLIDLVVANSHKAQLTDLIRQTLAGTNLERVHKSNIFKKEDFEPGGGTESTKTRTFLKIQDGCNSFCTYCVIPFARGKSRSLSVEALTKRVIELHSQGFNEVVLTGVHIGDYEFGLENLVQTVLENTEIPRVRLSSLEPIEVTDRLLELYSNPRLCPHFHMSIQSAETSVLKGMKRHYTADDVEIALNKINARVPNAFVGMDVIVGFPGETDEKFFETYQRLEGLPWTRIHVFPYSERPGTMALKIEGKIPQHLIHLRAERLRELSTQRFEKVAREQVGLTKHALYLKEKPPQALTRDYWPLELVSENQQLPGNLMTQGEEFEVVVMGYKPPEKSRMDGVLLGQIVRRFDAGHFSRL